MKPKPPPTDTLRRADGSEVVTARSMFRGALEMAEYIRGLSRVELEAFIKGAVPEFGGDLLEPSLFALVRLAELDPLAAVKQAGALARTEQDSSAFSLIMHDWLIRDRTAALKWFHAQPDTNAKAGFLGVAGMVLGQSDPELLKQLSGSIEDPDLQADGLQQSIMAQATTDPKAGLARLQELPDDESRVVLLNQLTMMHGDKMARELLEAAMPLASEHQRVNAASLLGQFAATDPKAALQWIAGRPEKDRELLSGLNSGLNLSGLGKLDTADVLAATINLPPAQQDWLMWNHYSGRPLDDPAALMVEASEAIKDPANRQMAQTHLVNRTVRAGREAALEPWISTLPPEEQAKVRTAITTVQKAR